MAKKNFIDQTKRGFVFFSGLILSLFMFYGCASQKSQLNVSQYRFQFNDETFRIRSIFSEDKTGSYNEIIGANFMAADFDQDRIIDHIQMGDVSLAEAQRVYEYGLDRLTKENKLQVTLPKVNRYIYENDDYQIEIRSFRPANSQPFNEFKIIDKRPVVCPEIIIIMDKNADGILDEVLKGSAAPEEIQARYAEVIEVGLQNGELININGTILVKED